MRLLIAVLVATLLGLVLSESASAHGDFVLVDRSLNLEPGQRVTYQGDVHYHRLIGQITADGPVSVQFVDDRSGEIVFDSGPLASLQMNQLVRCCDDLGWAPFTLVIDNPGAAAVTVDVRASLVHDDFAVFADGAEPGAHESIAILGALWAGLLWRAYRRNQPLPGIGRATRLAVALTAIALAITAYGSLRYGSGVIPAFLAGLSDVSIIPTNPMVSGTSLLLATLGTGWACAGIWWMRARNNAAVSSWLVLGLALFAMVVMTGIMFGQTYGIWWVPLAAGVVAGLPLLVVMAVRFVPAPMRQLARE